MTSVTEWEQDPWEAFRAGVECGCGLWDVMAIAIEMGWAGSPQTCKQKKDTLVMDVVNRFRGGQQVYSDEVEDLLQQRIMHDFNTMAEDGSCDWLSRLIVTLYDDCINKKDFTGLTKLVATLKSRPKTQVHGEESDDSEYSDGEEEMHDAADCMESMNMQEGGEEHNQSQAQAPEPVPQPPQQQEPMIDEDGFETVVRRKGGGRRKR